MQTQFKILLRNMIFTVSKYLHILWQIPILFSFKTLLPIAMSTDIILIQYFNNIFIIISIIKILIFYNNNMIF